MYTQLNPTLAVANVAALKNTMKLILILRKTHTEYSGVSLIKQ